MKKVQGRVTVSSSNMTARCITKKMKASVMLRIHTKKTQKLVIEMKSRLLTRCRESSDSEGGEATLTMKRNIRFVKMQHCIYTTLLRHYLKDSPMARAAAQCAHGKHFSLTSPCHLHLLRHDAASSAEALLMSL